jgi:hypothetical protein
MSGFAGTTDLADKTISFDELAPGPHGYIAAGDPNGDVVVGGHGVLIVDTRLTPLTAAGVIA